jgi:hypothetical protein
MPDPNLSDTTLEVTDTLGTFTKYLRLKAIGDGTHAIATSDPTGLVDVAYDNVVITYTDATKTTISTVVFKDGATTVCTLTLVQGTLTDTWARS